MNFALLSRLLGVIAILIGVTMLASLPWAHPALGHRIEEASDLKMAFESSGFSALIYSIVICLVVGSGLLWMGRRASGQMYRKEAMAVVGLSWVLATILGALPFYFSGTLRGPSIRIHGKSQPPQIIDSTALLREVWRNKSVLSTAEFEAVSRLVVAGARGLEEVDLNAIETFGSEMLSSTLRQLADGDPDWQASLLFPEDEGPAGRSGTYRIRWVPMNLCDCLFESQSGFSTTGATVISDLEDFRLVPHCILFWRSSTHFLGGLGIIVLFVAVLGHGSAGKALMRAEMPGPSKEGARSRMQQTAWLFAAMYVGLNVALSVILVTLGLSVFDAICHAFGTMATGGFSTYNSSVGHFKSASIDYTIIAFMILAGSNFTLLYLMMIGKPRALLKDIEWRTYMGVIFGLLLFVVVVGMYRHDFVDNEQLDGRSVGFFDHLSLAIRHGLFQIVAIITTTGFGTHDFDSWNSASRGALFVLMFAGGCAGSTGGGLKIIRHILFFKILRLEIEHAYHPSVVRPLRLGGEPVEDQQLRRNILVYFALVLVIFVISWMVLVAVEPDATWGSDAQHKLVDAASAVSATLNNIGPGLGTVGATQNYGHFTSFAKLLFTWLMMLGRLELYVILVLFVPGFWKNQT